MTELTFWNIRSYFQCINQTRNTRFVSDDKLTLSKNFKKGTHGINSFCIAHRNIFEYRSSGAQLDYPLLDLCCAFYKYICNVLLLACKLLKDTPPWMFFTFLNCANGTKSRNASHTIQGHSFSRKKFSWVLFFSLFSNCLIIYQYLIVTRTSFIWHVHIQNWVSFSRSWKNQNWLHLMQLKHLKTEQHKRNSLYWRPARQDSR